MSRIFLLAAVLAVIFDLGRACSCAWEHSQTHACRADFVILARILSRKPITDPAFPQADYFGYKLKITHVFKKDNETDSALLRTRFITTPKEESLCGVNLQIKQLYLITGNVYDNRAHVSICNFVRPWNHLSIVQRKGFRRNYYHSCDCKVRTCFLRDRSCFTPNNQGCFWSTSSIFESGDCQGKHSVCTRHASGMCDWQDNKYAEHCTKTKGGVNPNKNEVTLHRIEP